MSFMIEIQDTPQLTQIHIFKPSGKWYSSGIVDMSPFSDELIHVALFKACEADAGVSGRWPLSTSPRDLLDRSDDGGWMIVCIEPNHPHAHPIMLKHVPMDCK
jgi:hypothetical protein